MDRLRMMQVFVTVADCGGFSAAAKVLKISAPAATRAVAALEARLGSSLFARTTRAVRLTAVGQTYLADCRRVLADVDAAERSIMDRAEQPQGHLRITGSVMLGRLVLAPIVRTFLAEFPRVSAALTLLDRPTSLVEEGFDLALRVAPITDADLTGRKVGETRRVLVASPGYARARGLPDSPSDLMDHNIVGFERFMATSTWQLTQAGRAMTVTVRPRFMVNDAASAKEAALAGEGITMLLSYQVGHSIRRGELIPVLENYWPAATPIWLVHPSHARAAHIRAFADWSFRRLRDDIAEHCAFGPVVEKPTGDRSGVGHKAT